MGALIEEPDEALTQGPQLGAACSCTVRDADQAGIVTQSQFLPSLPP